MPREFTEKEQAFIDNVATGLTYVQAAKRAGYSKPDRAPSQLLLKPEIKQEVERLREENRRAKRMTREKVQEMVLEAYQVARLQSDANAMVRAVNELNRMLGFHTPEQINVNLTNTQEQKIQSLEVLSDEELLRLAAPEVIEGEFEEYPGDTDVREQGPEDPEEPPTD